MVDRINTKIENRICKFCNLRSVENEYHLYIPCTGISRVQRY